MCQAGIVTRRLQLPICLYGRVGWDIFILGGINGGVGLLCIVRSAVDLKQTKNEQIKKHYIGWYQWWCGTRVHYKQTKNKQIKKHYIGWYGINGGVGL